VGTDIIVPRLHESRTALVPEAFMILPSSSRTFTGLAFALVLLLPSLARAQQPVVPATGEPPPPETRVQEQAVIANQAQQAYVATHQEELRREAARQVEEERRAAWAQRGRDNIPPPVIVRPPAFSLTLSGRFGVGLGDGADMHPGLSTELDLRVSRWWGLGVNAGLLSSRIEADVYVPNSRLGAVITEASGYLAIPGKSRRYVDATHGVLRVGHQLLFPIGQPALPTVYLGLFAGLGGVFPVGPIAGGKGWVGLSFETRIGYRFGLGSGADSPVEGSFLDVMAGPLVGF
jgi:hypothetical protein